MVIRPSTTSKIGVAKSPGGRPTRATVPLRRTMCIASVNAGGDTAVTSTPCTSPRSMSPRTSWRGDVHAHGLGVLDSQLAQPAHAGDRDPLARPHLRLLDALVGRHPGAQDRR